MQVRIDRCRLFGVVLFSLVVTTQLSAAGVLDPLQQVVASARNDFRDIRGAKNEDGSYETTMQIELMTCHIDRADGSPLYECTWKMSAANTEDVFKELRREIIDLFPARNWQETVSAGRPVLRSTEAGVSIRLSIRSSGIAIMVIRL